MILHEYLERQKAWSKKTFGNGLRTVGICKHIVKETKEVRANPNDLEEWCDIIILALDGAWRTGARLWDIEYALMQKQKKNMERKWPEKTPEDKPIEHLREEAGK